MSDVSGHITALEFASGYIPGQDDNYSHSVLLGMSDELRAKEVDPSGGNRKRSMDK